ncbi:MAG TPA: cytochrome c oxidase subunit II, partial [Pararhizobium sp.]|nr:cytochrome c oxidase subunit II [Pararhizobium sp.]
MTEAGTGRIFRLVAVATATIILSTFPLRLAHARAPLSYLWSFGEPAGQILPLTWGLFILSLFVIFVIGMLVLVGVLVRRYREPWRIGTDVPVTAGGSGALNVVYGGLIVTVAILTGFIVWTIATMVGISSPQAKVPFTIQITAHQWWWQVEYLSPDTSQRFVTANEIHIPVGEPIRFKLRSEDVIHSFWVPALAGKTDVIPGHPNQMWLKADKPGIYRGQCLEYCGRQHAHMAFRVFADTPEQFARWWQNQLKAAPAPTTEEAKTGLHDFLLQCSACHAIRGTPAGGTLG